MLQNESNLDTSLEVIGLMRGTPMLKTTSDRSAFLIDGKEYTLNDFVQSFWVLLSLYDTTCKELGDICKMVEDTGLVDTRCLNAVEAVGELVGDDDIVMYRRSNKQAQEKAMQELVELSEELGLYG